jgi:hypothetical protein
LLQDRRLSCGTTLRACHATPHVHRGVFDPHRGDGAAAATTTTTHTATITVLCRPSQGRTTTLATTTTTSAAAAAAVTLSTRRFVSFPHLGEQNQFGTRT